MLTKLHKYACVSYQDNVLLARLTTPAYLFYDSFALDKKPALVVIYEP